MQNCIMYKKQIMKSMPMICILYSVTVSPSLESVYEKAAAAMTQATIPQRTPIGYFYLLVQINEKVVLLSI